MGALTTVEKHGEIVVSESQDSGAAFLTIIAAAARDPQVDIAKMESLLRMQETINTKQAEMAYNQAMSRLQARLPVIAKRRKIEFKGVVQSKFAAFEDIDAIIRPLLREEGFSISFGTSAIDKGILVSATLSHSQGHSKTETMPLPFDTSGSKNSIQAVGSSLQYGKRYLTCAMLNLVTIDEDDDAQKLSYVTERERLTVVDMIAECEMSVESQSKFLEIMGVKSVGEIRRSDFEKAMNNLRKKLRQKQGGAA